MISFLGPGSLTSVLIISESPFFETIPNLAAISCKIIVEKMDKSNAQSKEKPNSSPAMLQIVTVPGPIKAAAINGPGPIFFLKILGKDFFTTF